jgi:hypothetical protein
MYEDSRARILALWTPGSANHVRPYYDELIHVPDGRLLVGVSQRLLCSHLLRYGALWPSGVHHWYLAGESLNFRGFAIIPRSRFLAFFDIISLSFCGVELAVYFPAKISTPRECR